ncbi:MAG TPA: response regulator [Patescibacteria group bacterium]|nr:response regulator [Patescibacteria group bacterium]
MKKILIVEDELAYLKLLNNQLTKNGYKVVEAKNGKEGLLVAEKEHPDAIILDIRMPVMSGIEMLTKLRKSNYGKTANVIILTNLEPDDEILRSVLEDQPTYYLMKSDIHITDLINKINKLS